MTLPVSGTGAPRNVSLLQAMRWRSCHLWRKCWIYLTNHWGDCVLLILSVSSKSGFPFRYNVKRVLFFAFSLEISGEAKLCLHYVKSSSRFIFHWARHSHWNISEVVTGSGFIRHDNCYESSRINKVDSLHRHWVVTEKDLLRLLFLSCWCMHFTLCTRGFLSWCEKEIHLAGYIILVAILS